MQITVSTKNTFLHVASEQSQMPTSRRSSAPSVSTSSLADFGFPMDSPDRPLTCLSIKGCYFNRDLELYSTDCDSDDQVAFTSPSESCRSSCSDLIDIKTRTTVMVRNIPCKYVQETVMEEMATINPEFNFVFVPGFLKKAGNLGYAFVNFTTAEGAVQFMKEFSGHQWERQRNSPKRAEVSFAEVQGLEENVFHFQRKLGQKTVVTPYVNYNM